MNVIKLHPISTLLNDLTIAMSNDAPTADHPQASIQTEVEPAKHSIKEIDEEGNTSALAQHDDDDKDGNEYDEDLLAECPMLTCLDEGDVALDMDDWTLEDDDDGADKSEDEFVE